MTGDKREKKVISDNRKAFYEYFIEERFEAGIELKGSEVKSLRAGKINMMDSFADFEGEELYLRNCHIAEYSGANQFNHHPTRPRKLLLHKQEIKKLFGKVKQKGYTLVPLSFYFNEKNRAKVELGLAKGKKQHDKREAEKQRDWDREKSRIMKSE